MSSGTRMLFGFALAIVLLSCSVNGHGWMSSPAPRGQYLSPPKRPDFEYQPATTDPTEDALVCRNDPVMPKANWLPLHAGQPQSITLEFNAKHVGDCFVYLTYDGDKPQNQMKWFKIWEQHSCKDNNNYNIPIPSYLPSGDHVIFRWEWYALHVYPKIEYYSQCVDATMSGVAQGQLPQPQVNMPGHLPAFSGDYADRTNNYWWPWDTQPMFFTGPALATLNGQSSRPTDAPVTAATTRPTNPPTNPPAVTVKPTTPPAATVKPTNPPAATVKPTTPPAATVKPTTAPAPTVKPAPSQSVKLNILNSASVWWFATTLSGHRANEVTKMEIKDSNHFSSWTTMELGWSATGVDTWVFNPASNGPLVHPLTIKASLPSGSCLSFVVNSPGSTVIDSGAVFP